MFLENNLGYSVKLIINNFSSNHLSAAAAVLLHSLQFQSYSDFFSSLRIASAADSVSSVLMKQKRIRFSAIDLCSADHLTKAVVLGGVLLPAQVDLLRQPAKVGHHKVATFRNGRRHVHLGQEADHPISLRL
ncbi:hypothetical protein TYRP_019835 [Tyrophagus putrescentiae]|nr:hypothetical protein TYRP_019835 [Tyrophagus putrescentiae]